METTTNVTSSYLNAYNVNTTKPCAITSSWYEANYHNAPTNVKMTLADARTELESRGFIILDQHQQEDDDVLSSSSLSSSSNLLVGRRSEFHWYKVEKMDTLVFVQELCADPLTVDRIQEDLQKLKMDWIVSLPRSFYSPSGCPPHGLGRARTILMVYLTRQQPIAADVALYLTHNPPPEWCQLTFLAAQDGTNGASYYYGQESSASCCGKGGMVYYGQARYWAGLLTGRRPWWVKPSQNKMYWLLFHFVLVNNFLVFCRLNAESGLWLWVRTIGIVIGIFVVLSFCMNGYYECQRRQRQQQRHVLAQSNNNV